MTALTVVLNGQQMELTEQDVKEMLVNRALAVARDRNVRWYLSAVGRAIQDITNLVYEGRQRAMRTSDYIEVPFPEAWELQEQLVFILQSYCMRQGTTIFSDWEAGWETTVVPQINAYL